MRKLKMPKNRKEFETQIENAFIAGCQHGYWVEHTVNISEQENLGAMWYLGKITKEELSEKMKEMSMSKD